MRRLIVGALIALLALAVAPVARAAVLEDAARALRSDPVYVAPDAELKLSSADAGALRRRIARGDAGPVYVADLPASAVTEAGGQPSEVPRRLARLVGRRGSYATIVGHKFEAGSLVVPGAGRLANEALQARRAFGPRAVIEDWIDRLAAARHGGGAGGGTGAGAGRGNGGSGSATGLLVLLGVLGGGALLAVSVSRRRRRQEEQRQLEELRTAARDDLVALGEDVRSVDIDMEMPGVDPRAKEELGRALEAYERAERGLQRARRPEDIADVTRTIDDGRQAMAAVRALLEGREPPPRRPPCFFDPRHGPSVTEVEWAPPGGEPRPVPVCAACAARLARGEEPVPRQVVAGGQSVPYWNAPAYFSPWAGGFFGGSMFLPGLLGGTLLGSALGGGWGFGDSDARGDDGGGWGDGGDGGDWGGGDLGGGGGGDFGGGDFGGGDVGGGDF